MRRWRRRQEEREHAEALKRLEAKARRMRPAPAKPPWLTEDEYERLLDRLAAKDPEKAELVKLRYFAGLTADQAAAALGISTATAYRHWAYARAWLRGELLGDREH